jgi:hypothetical protein
MGRPYGTLKGECLNRIECLEFLGWVCPFGENALGMADTLASHGW